jgi:hypothetical protein
MSLCLSCRLLDYEFRSILRLWVWKCRYWHIRVEHKAHFMDNLLVDGQRQTLVALRVVEVPVNR